MIQCELHLHTRISCMSYFETVRVVNPIWVGVKEIDLWFAYTKPAIYIKSNYLHFHCQDKSG